nr:immunoglobulin light chain junction region [Macaca mulatta]MOV83825.1 immunoglobulin light chain junction region [Macaca mulatta]MOV86486.1 immunoglobulin light chain junction region [Macaca mulatta]MOW52747.1 immunoglobulin light chain junction region [Macaca mulatta]
CSQDIQLPLTF